MLDDEVYIGMPGLWTLITDKVLKLTQKKTMRDTKSYCMKPMLCTVTMTLKAVILELTDQLSGTKFCDQWEEFQQKGMVHSDYNDDEQYFSGDGLYLQKNGCCFNIRRIGTGIYLRPHPMLAGVYGKGLYIHRGFSIYDGDGLMLGPSKSIQEDIYIRMGIVIALSM